MAERKNLVERNKARRLKVELQNKFQIIEEHRIVKDCGSLEKI